MTSSLRLAGNKSTPGLGVEDTEEAATWTRVLFPRAAFPTLGANCPSKCSALIFGLVGGSFDPRKGHRVRCGRVPLVAFAGSFNNFYLSPPPTLNSCLPSFLSTLSLRKRMRFYALPYVYLTYVKLTEKGPYVHMCRPIRPRGTPKRPRAKSRG